MMTITNHFKILTAIFTTFLFANHTTAQEAENYDQNFRLGIGVKAGYIFQEPFQHALGGDIRLQYDLSKRYSLTLTTGYTNLSVSGNDNDLGFIPVKAGYKTFIWEDQFYVMAEIGVAISVTHDYNKTSLVIAPCVGYASKYIDISLHYERYADFAKENDDGSVGQGVGQIGVRLAYGFKL